MKPLVQHGSMNDGGVCPQMAKCGIPVFDQSADLLQRRWMMTAGHDEVAAMLNVLLESQGFEEMSEIGTSSSSGVSLTQAGVQTDGVLRFENM